MANNFITNIFKTQENVNKDNMNYTVADKDQKVTSFFPMPSKNLVSGILPGVICSGIGTIDSQFGFNSISPNIFSLGAGVLRFPDSYSNLSPYNNNIQTTLVTVAQFVSLDSYNQTLTVTPGSYYLIATLSVLPNSQYQFTNYASYSIITIPTAPNPPFNINQLALCRIDISATNVITISTDANCAINYGTIQYKSSPEFYQQGRLTGSQGNPYGNTLSISSSDIDTTPNGSETLYFTPTEQGNLISLYNGYNWITQSFKELSLPISVNNGLLNGLTPSTVPALTNPQLLTISPNTSGVSNIYVVTNAGSSNNGTVLQYTRNVTTGQLQALSTPIATGNNPQGIAITQNGRYVYVTNNPGGTGTSGTVSIYNRSTSDGTLTNNSTYTGSTGITPGTIAIKDNSYLYFTTSNSSDAGQVFQNNIDSSSGTLTGLGLSVNTNGQGSDIVISNDGLNMYVCGGNGNNNVYTIFINQRNGNLTPTNPTSIATGNNPSALTISLDGNNVYVTNKTDNTISQYSRNSSTGLLTAIGVSNPVLTGNSPVGISISSDGNFVYVLNTGANNISQYSRNTGTGILTLITTSSPVTTGTTPVGIIISPDNSNAYITNSVDNTISQYSRTGTTFIPNGTYDIYVANISNILTLSTIAWNVNTPPLRTRQDGRWVNGIAIGTVPIGTALLIGSINISNGKVQAWSGNYSIWNLYNQVLLLGQAYIYNGGVSWNPPGNTTIQTFAIPSPSGAGQYGLSQIGLMIDPLVKSIIIKYSGQIIASTGSNRFSVSFGINNSTTPIHPIITSINDNTVQIRGGATTDGNSKVNTLEFNFNIIDITSVPFSNDTTTSGNGFTNTNIVGFNNIIRLESHGYSNTQSQNGVSISDNNGLTVEFWG